jgi:hypothetical protein
MPSKSQNCSGPFSGEAPQSSKRMAEEGELKVVTMEEVTMRDNQEVRQD